MKVVQLSVFLENRAGRLGEVIRTLAEAGINIRGLSLADTSDFGILRLIVCEESRASEILLKNGFTIGRTDVVAVSIQDKAGGLDRIVRLVSARNINVEYMYGCSNMRPEKAVMIFRFDKIDEAIHILNESGAELVPGAALCSREWSETARK